MPDTPKRRDYPRGFVIVPREHFSEADPFWSEPRKYSPWEAWLYLVQMAAFRPTTRTYRGHVIELDRAELLASKRYLAPKWNWGPKAVAGYLARLETRLGVLRTQRKTQGGTVYRVVEYDLYQPPGTTNGTSKGTEVEPGTHQQGHVQGTESKEQNQLQITESTVAGPRAVDDGEVVLWIPCRCERPGQLDGWGSPFRLNDDGGEYGLTQAELELLETTHGSPAWAPDPEALDVEATIADTVVKWASRQKPQARPYYANVHAMLDRWLGEEAAKLKGAQQ